MSYTFQTIALLVRIFLDASVFFPVCVLSRVVKSSCVGEFPRTWSLAKCLRTCFRYRKMFGTGPH